MAKTILIVDDEPDICEILRFNLELDGYEVLTAEGVCDAQVVLDSRHVDLIVLDVIPHCHNTGERVDAFLWHLRIPKRARFPCGYPALTIATQ